MSTNGTTSFRIELTHEQVAIVKREVERLRASLPKEASHYMARTISPHGLATRLLRDAVLALPSAQEAA